MLNRGTAVALPFSLSVQLSSPVFLSFATSAPVAGAALRTGVKSVWPESLRQGERGENVDGKRQHPIKVAHGVED